MSVPTPTQNTTSMVNVNAVRAALKDIPGIIRAVHVQARRGEEAVWIVLDNVDLERDRQVVDAMMDFEGFDFHFATERTQGMVPDGRTII